MNRLIGDGVDGSRKRTDNRLSSTTAPGRLNTGRIEIPTGLSNGGTPNSGAVSENAFFYQQSILLRLRQTPYRRKLVSIRHDCPRRRRCAGGAILQRCIDDVRSFKFCLWANHGAIIRHGANSDAGSP